MRLKFEIKRSNPGLYVVAIASVMVPDGVADGFADAAEAPVATTTTARSPTRLDLANRVIASSSLCLARGRRSRATTAIVCGRDLRLFHRTHGLSSVRYGTHASS